MLKELLNTKKCFKLVCGAGNEDANEVEKLVALYSSAGCKFFDLSAKPQIVDSAKRGLNGREGYLCVSVGIKGDPHIRKAQINPEQCIHCHKCEEICPQNSIYDGLLSICTARGHLSEEKMIERINKMIANRKPFSTIIQADGFPMSGGQDDYKTTLQAIATAEIVQNAKLPVYIMLSGGTNSKTAELAKMCNIDYNGIAIGTFARKIVKKYIEREDFLRNEHVFNEALKIAKWLIEKV